ERNEKKAQLQEQKKREKDEAKSKKEMDELRRATTQTILCKVLYTARDENHPA
ncbi:hypothetical protein CRUP_031338, partial [Coryphaenoides rupestris]